MLSSFAPSCQNMCSARSLGRRCWDMGRLCSWALIPAENLTNHWPANTAQPEASQVRVELVGSKPGRQVTSTHTAGLETQDVPGLARLSRGQPVATCAHALGGCQSTCLSCSPWGSQARRWYKDCQCKSASPPRSSRQPARVQCPRLYGRDRGSLSSLHSDCMRGCT